MAVSAAAVAKAAAMLLTNEKARKGGTPKLFQCNCAMYVLQI